VRSRLLLCAALALSGALLGEGRVCRAEETPREPTRLGGTELTPLGAERAGSADGRIPPWTGGIQEWPPGFEPGDHHPDPFPEDRVLFRIDATNLDRHAEHLSEGQRELLRSYPDTWRLNVYPTRRSASYPDWVYEAVKENARTARAVLKGKGGVTDAHVSSPFPIPRLGVEVVWNHNLRFRGIRVQRSEGMAPVTRAGRYRVVLREQDLAFPYAAREETAFRRERPNLLFAFKTKTVAPALLSGNGGLVLEPIDQTRQPRKSWSYVRNLRRVVRDPTIGYGFAARNTDGLRTVDDYELFNGPPDRFEWKLLGKKQLYIPYNAYRLHGAEVGPGDLLARNHLEPELARYELHRVWVVEGTLKPGMQHVYSRRVFYLDEDSWQIAVADSWDLQGRLWRVNEAHALNYYDVPVLWSTLEVFHDLRERRYLVNGLDNDRNAYRFSEGGDPREFTPSALLYYVR
jgi:hypothetical protein